MLMLTMITRVFDAGWAPVIRRNWEFMIGALPVVLLLGVVPLATGAIGWCPPYALLGFNTCAVKK